MTVFVCMAVGLNMVVGYAGLLDLGYVAFYAIGSYVAGWFASTQFASHSIVFGAVGVQSHAIGIHISIWLLLAGGGGDGGRRGCGDRPAHAASAR